MLGSVQGPVQHHRDDFSQHFPIEIKKPVPEGPITEAPRDGHSLDIVSPSCIVWDWPLRKDCNHWRTEPPNAKLDSWLRRILWSTVSKVTERSRRTSKVTLPLPASLRRSSYRVTKAPSVTTIAGVRVLRLLAQARQGGLTGWKINCHKGLTSTIWPLRLQCTLAKAAAFCEDHFQYSFFARLVRAHW